MIKKYTIGFVAGVVLSAALVLETSVPAEMRLPIAVIIISIIQAGMSAYMLIEELWKTEGGRAFVRASTKIGLLGAALIFFPAALCVLPLGLVALAASMRGVGSMVAGTAAMMERDKQSMGSWS